MKLSVVIPALNEARALPKTLASIHRGDGVEVIVVDGGSSDATCDIARNAGAMVIDSDSGRARQMNAGARASSGDALLFLHADTLLFPQAPVAIKEALSVPGTTGGCFRLRFDERSPLLDFYTLGVWMRRPSLTFGDRAIFASRTAFEAVGGFPDQPIFEDLEIVRRLRDAGRFVYLDEEVTTSARRFRQNGRFRQQVKNGLLWGAWLCGIRDERLAAFYGYDQAASGA